MLLWLFRVIFFFCKGAHNIDDEQCSSVVRYNSHGLMIALHVLAEPPVSNDTPS